MDTKTSIGLSLVAAGLAAVWLASRKPQFRWPLTPHRITSPYGYRTDPINGKQTFHNGVDLAAKTGTPVLATANGLVTEVLTNSTGGNQLVILHDSGYRSGYAHLSRYAVKKNQRVTAGQVVAYSGATGRVTGAHLHFVMRNPSSTLINPVDYLS